jgi:hypothetical protein
MTNNNWIWDINPNITAKLIADYVLMWELANEAGFDPHEEDVLVWTRTLDGAYSAKSVYEMQFDGNVTSSFSSCIWKVWALSRCKFFIWLMLQNIIWTLDRLQQRGWPNDYFCPFCPCNLKTDSHLFQDCPVAR